MPISITIDSATISTTEYSLPTDSTTRVSQTDDCLMQVFIGFENMVAGDRYRVRIYEKIDGGSEQVVYEAFVVGVSGPFVSPALIVGEGWDVTVLKEAGTDRSITWSIRKVT